VQEKRKAQYKNDTTLAYTICQNAVSIPSSVVESSKMFPFKVDR